MPIGAIAAIAIWFFIASADPHTVKVVGWCALGVFVLFCAWISSGSPPGHNGHDTSHDNDHSDFQYRQDRERRDAILRMRDKDRENGGWF